MSLMISHSLSAGGTSVGSGCGAAATSASSPLGRLMVNKTPLSSPSSIRPPFYVEEEDEPPSSSNKNHQYQYLYVLPVLLLEFLAVALTRAVLPSLLLEQYGKDVYLVLGVADCVRGLLAFAACPIFGKLSDVIGRRICLFATVLGTCAPVCSLAFFTWEFEGEAQEGGGGEWGSNNATMSIIGGPDDIADISSISNTTSYNSAEAAAAEPIVALAGVHPHAINSFVILLALSGVFSSTFTLIFAYISDTVPRQDERVSAYGLALATFGLSFTIGMSFVWLLSLI
jgi:MFS family permease